MLSLGFQVIVALQVCRCVADEHVGFVQVASIPRIFHARNFLRNLTAYDVEELFASAAQAQKCMAVKCLTGRK